jgi:dipeptidyl aminopeptidase/acylaminoacyl peptidase
MPEKRSFRILLCAILLLAAVAIAAVGVVSRNADVRALDLSPENGADDVPITTPISISFSQPMDRESVEARFGMEPAVDGQFVWEGNDVSFVPQAALSPGTAYSITLKAGSVSEGGQQVQENVNWRFRTRVPQILYLGRPDSDASPRQIYTVNQDGFQTRQLTNHPWGVWDYAVHPQGEAIIYAALREDGGADLWRMDRNGSNQELLRACPEVACVSPAWSPDGRLVAYEQRDIWADAPNLDPKAGRLWLRDMEVGSGRPLFDYDVAAHSPVWAPDSQRIAYVNPLLPGIEVYHLETGELQQFGNHWGATPVWSPDGSRLVLPDLVLIGEKLIVRLVVIEGADEQAIEISGDDDLVKDDAPAWSPVGGWVAHGRQFLDEERWMPGRQIWLTRPDGSEAYPLLAEPMTDLFGAIWRPDGTALAYLQTDLAEGPQAMPDISLWVFDLMAREGWQVADQGVLPRWMP